ncbi:MAG: hypothetical protein PHV68_08960 [Candidatus Gastranaerophilales bacterium]|nr:hypothetical protein [Candidatus Gastranaerophilales bacterium]
MDKNNEQMTNVISRNFEKKNVNNPTTCNEVFKNQSNPIKKSLFSLISAKLSGKKDSYKSFSKFTPDDLR